MDTPQSKTATLDILKNYLPSIIAVGGGFVALVLAWKDIADTKKNVDVLKEQVTKQYSTQRDMNDKTNKEVDDLKLWKAYEEGYHKGITDSKK